MQVRVNRTSIVHLVAFAIAAVMGIGAHPAFAQSTTVSPAGTNFTAMASPTAPAAGVRFTLGTVAVTCNTSSTSGGAPAAPANHNPAGPVCGPISTPTFGGCTTSLGTAATVTASGAWSFCAADNGGSPTGSLIIPQNGVVASTVIFGVTCTVTAAPGGPVTVTGTWNNGPPPTLAFNAASVPVRPSGGFPCPTGTTSSLTGTYVISPNITVGP